MYDVGNISGKEGLDDPMDDFLNIPFKDGPAIEIAQTRK